MKQSEFSGSLKKAIEAGEVEINEGERTARILIKVMASPTVVDPDREIGPILARLTKHLGLKAELEHLGYKVESGDPAVANELTRQAIEKTYAEADHTTP